MRTPLAVALALTLSLGGCSSESNDASAVTLAQLVRFAERYDGQRVTVSGTVQSHPDPEHYWIEDDDLNRVAIQPARVVEGRVGESIRVRGAFRYSRDTGRIIQSEQVTPLP